MGGVDAGHGREARVPPGLITKAPQALGETGTQLRDGGRHDQQLTAQLERTFGVERPEFLGQRRQRIGRGLRRVTARYDRAPPERRRGLGPGGQLGARGQRRAQMSLGRLELHGGHLVPAQLGQDLRPFLPRRGFSQRPPQTRRGHVRSATARRARRSRPERVDPALIPGRGGQQQVRRDPLGRSTLPGQCLDGRGMPCLTLAGRQILIQRGTHDRVNEPQPLGRNEDVGPDEVVCRLPGRVRAQPRHAAGEQQLAVVSQYGDGSRQLGRGRAERGEPVQDEPAHRGRSDRLDLARSGRRRLDPGGAQGFQQLPQEKRVAAGRVMAGTAELLGRLRPQAIPGQSDRSRLAQRPRIQHRRGGTGRHLRPERSRAGHRGIRRTPSENHRDRKPFDALGQVGQESQ